MTPSNYRVSRFETDDGDPMGPLANLADIMLVLAVGLMVALAAAQGGLQELQSGVEVKATRELPEVPTGVSEEGRSGLESAGRVYRDPETGRMVWIEKDESQ